MRIRITQDLQLKIRQLLEINHAYRDSDYRILSQIWSEECQALGENFFDAFANEKLTPPESVTRARCKIQEEHVHLRGSKWYERHDNQQTIQEDLGYQSNLF